MFAEERARALHRQFHLTLPVDVEQLAGRLGAVVLAQRFPEPFADAPGFSFRQFIYVSERLTEPERRYVVAHELHHYLADAYDQLKLFTMKDQRGSQMEWRAMAFADELLIPLADLRRAAEELWPAWHVRRHFGLPLPLVNVRWLNLARQLGRPMGRPPWEDLQGTRWKHVPRSWW